MSVRISKPPVNIREKLAELERPIGLNGSTLMRTETPQEAFSLIGAGRRNRIINGSMVVNQRNLGTVTHNTSVSTSFGVDRWNSQCLFGSTTYSTQPSSVAPAGFTNSILVTTVTSGAPAAGDTKYFMQYIEGYNVADFGWGTANAKTVTLSFWVRSSVTGTFGVGIANVDAARSYATPYTISAANTWEYKTITIPGDTTGTWNKDNTTGIRVGFNIGTGSNFHQTTNAWTGAGGGGRGAFSGVTSLLATAGATWYITGVQLEEGKVATPFEHRSIGEELALCQRYTFRYTVAGNNPWGIHVGAFTSTRAFGVIYTPVEMRTIPSITYTGTPDIRSFALSPAYNITALTPYSIRSNLLSVDCYVASGLAVNSSYWLNLTDTIFSSEL